MDPRTGLDVVAVPAEYEKFFRTLNGCVIHWIGAVDKYNRNYKPQRRVAIFTDECIYLCQMDGVIRRCLQIRTIKEILLGEHTKISFRAGPPDSFDMLIAVEHSEAREYLIHVVAKVYWSLTGQEINIRALAAESGETLPTVLQLTKPKQWQLKVLPMRTMKEVITLVKQQQEAEMMEKSDFGGSTEGAPSEQGANPLNLS